MLNFGFIVGSLACTGGYDCAVLKAPAVLPDRSACGLALVPSSASSPLTFLGARKVWLARLTPVRRTGWLGDLFLEFCYFKKLLVPARCRSLPALDGRGVRSRSLGSTRWGLAALGRASPSPNSSPRTPCCAGWGPLGPR